MTDNPAVWNVSTRDGFREDLASPQVIERIENITVVETKQSVFRNPWELEECRSVERSAYHEQDDEPSGFIELDPTNKGARTDRRITLLDSISNLPTRYLLTQYENGVEVYMHRLPGPVDVGNEQETFFFEEKDLEAVVAAMLG